MQGIVPREPHLLDQVRDKIRFKHDSIRTEHAYVDGIKRFILFHNNRHPKEMGPREAEQSLTHLATERNVASSTQNQALSAILFLYREVLKIELPWLENAQCAKKPRSQLTCWAAVTTFARCKNYWDIRMCALR